MMRRHFTPDGDAVLLAAPFEVGVVVGATLPWPRSYCGHVDELLSMARRFGATCVLLDVRLGGQRSRAIEWAPLLAALPLTPAVIALGWRASELEAHEARQWGCADYVDLSAATWAADLADAVATALAVRRRDLAEGRTTLGQARARVH